MTDAVIHRLAGKLWKCPFDDQLFDSVIGLGSHLLEFHGNRLCEKQQVLREPADQASEKPVRLSVCIYCQQGGRYFAIPRFPDWQADDGIIAHIDQNHLLPSGRPAPHSFLTAHSAEEIDKFMEWQRWSDEYRCLECSERFDDWDSIGWHWIDEHIEHAKPEDIDRVLQTNPGQLWDSFPDLRVQVLAEAEAEAERSARAETHPHEEYRIRHMPPVPRVRSRASKDIIYITAARLPKDEILELLEMEGLDGAKFTGGDWRPDRVQTAMVDLRFCNLQDGYIPPVKNVCNILPEDIGGKTIEMTWHAEQTSWFSCIVSEWDHAIYNPDGRLKTVFSNIPPGARLYIDRVGQTRYQLHLKRSPHVVRNCKFFEKNGAGGWNVVSRDERIDWESDDDIFRHQITFLQMDALYAEAEHTNLSVRDAVHDFMQRFAREEAWHVRDIYEFVFQQLRTCSLTAVWAQFRPEHECYVRDPNRLGFYGFDPKGAFPAVRVLRHAGHTDGNMAGHDGIGKADSTSLRIVVRWSQILGEPCNDEEFKDGSAGAVQARFLGNLLKKFPHYTARLTREKVSRFPLSTTPETSFRNSQRGSAYGKKPVPGTQPQLFLCTQGTTTEKRRDTLGLIERLGLPRGSVEVFIVPRMTKKEAFFASLGL